VLYEIGATHLPEVLVLNKVDCASPEALTGLRHAYPGALEVSALTGEGVEELRGALTRLLRRPTPGTEVPTSAG
jgi:GTP-binding protein HflX